jgi:hypothetical protein
LLALKVTLSGLTITPGNGAAATDPGLGGSILNNGSTLTLSACILPDNSALVAGGAVDNLGILTVSGCTLSSNSAGIGVAIRTSSSISGGICYGGTLTVRDSLLIGNSAIAGGAIYNDAVSTLAVRGSTFSGNTATLPYNSAGFGDHGGGLFNVGTATLQECSRSGNTAGDGGGGIFNSGTLAIKDSNVLGNTAPSRAELYNLGALTLDDSTVGVIGP